MRRLLSLLPLCLLLNVSPALARNCPSTCSGYLFTVGDTLELGGEFRAFYLGISVGGLDGMNRRRGDLPTARFERARVFENNVFLALRPLLNWYPADGLTITLEHEARFRWPGWDENVVPGTDFAVAGLDHRPTAVFIEYETQGVTIAGGLLPLSFGSGALLDQRLLALSVGYDHEIFSLEAFGGMMMRNLMRNAAHSLWMSYTADTNGWKWASNDPTENYAVGMSFSLKVVRPFRLQLLYLYSHPNLERLESHSVGLHLSGPLWRPYLSLLIEPLLVIAPNGAQEDADYLPGIVAEIRARFGREASSPELLLGGASSFRHDDQLERRMTSVLENLSVGTLRRFNLEQGHLFYARASWQPIEYVRLYGQYSMAFPDGGESLTDELDAGLWVQVNDLYRLNLAYIGVNLAGALEPSHALYAELRIVIGPNE